ncbi:GNAT family protein [Tumebacillus sp. DT12]|uniref:GNAT family protein n=1 Tax=Tumebacillus lacus TaxID=2995335 RepID=A0ABT3WYP1_9BACL|nr:GNAT family protein [Tumebacillus lacus]MCX7569321.1 GNAT family protein [Tumebacillus lacus]
MQGKRVVLRDVTCEDLDRLYEYTYLAEDREHRNWNGPYIPIPERTREVFRKDHQHYLDAVAADAVRICLGIEIDGELRGTVTRYWVDENTKWLEIGIVLYDSRNWSGGYGTEAFQMWIDYLFAEMDDIVRLGIATWSGNERMMRLAARCGMIEEGRMRKARIVRGDYYDAIKMGILREEWEAKTSQSKQKSM